MTKRMDRLMVGGLLLLLAAGQAGATSAAGDPRRGLRAECTVTVTVLPWVYVTPLESTPLVLPRKEQGRSETDGVMFTFRLPATMAANPARWDEAEVNGVPVALALQSTSPHPPTDETTYRLRVPRGELARALGEVAGLHEVRLDVPLASGDAISCCGQVELRTPPGCPDKKKS